MDFVIDWKNIKNANNSLWDHFKGLYAYLYSNKDSFLYIGKCWSTSVWERWNAPDKNEFKQILIEEKNINSVRVMVGVVSLNPNEVGRFTKEMLADIESLLIMREQPWWNLKCKNSRIARPGMN